MLTSCHLSLQLQELLRSVEKPPATEYVNGPSLYEGKVGFRETWTADPSDVEPMPHMSSRLFGGGLEGDELGGQSYSEFGMESQSSCSSFVTTRTGATGATGYSAMSTITESAQTGMDNALRDLQVTPTHTVEWQPAPSLLHLPSPSLPCLASHLGPPPPFPPLQSKLTARGGGGFDPMQKLKNRLGNMRTQKKQLQEEVRGRQRHRQGQ